MIKLSAQEIVDYARTHEIKLTVGGIRHPNLDAGNLILHMITKGRGMHLDWFEMVDEVLARYGIDFNGWGQLEIGFSSPSCAMAEPNNPGYQIGVEIRRLLGITEELIS